MHSPSCANHGALLAVMFCAPLAAQTWQASGFLSQAYMNTQASEFVVGADHSSVDLTEAMLAASWRSESHLRVAGALNYRQWGELTASRVDFDYLFAEYNWQLWQGQQGIRLGRVKGQFGLYSSTRDVPFTRPGIMLPQSIYPSLYRDAHLRINGADWFGEYLLGGGVVHFHLIAGYPSLTDELVDNIFGDPSVGDFEAKPYYSLSVSYQNESWFVGSSYYYADIGFDGAGYLVDGSIGVHSWIASVQYRQDWWQLTSELSMRSDVTAGIYPLNTEKIRREDSGFYVEGRAFLPHDLQLYLRFDDYISNRDDPDGREFEAKTGIPAYFAYSKDWALGGQWFFSPSWMLALEYHWLEGAAWVPSFAEREPLTQAKDWSIFAAQLSYRFQW
ncbi:hypothetical protein [Shewanella sp. NIFS-20-20]|uniref:hypothetical protein n=1 Tax=Shewanella sp. NIFS-20-20 TaxID=2853806 RepID=UPI001C44C61D|nr:hypothetical protein [Shewanella sp. NIFS-20-20]MBV7314069.1 hypothetical protein [Shewanella sp. NIFS-20-20]